MSDTTPLTSSSDATVTLAATSRPVEVIGPYRLVGHLGKGGMGMVHRAVHEVTGRVVALKVIDLSGSQLKRHLEQVTHEAMAMAALRHPHVITCYSFGEDGRHLYLALELIPGGDTAGLVARSGGRLDEGTIRKLACQCAEGLAAIHRAGLVHRDIKPANILLDEHGDAKLADFGLACFGQPSDATASGKAGVMPEAGTPAYMPPEAVTGGCTPDIRGDIYSLGATMYYWAAGRPPFAGSNAFATMQLVLAGNTPDLAGLRPDLSADLVEIIATAMRNHRDLRYQDPLTLLRALRGDAQAIIPTPLPAPRVREPEADQPAHRSRRLMWAAGLIGMIIIAALAFRPLPKAAERGALIAHAPESGGRGPAPHSTLGDGYRLAWLGDPLVRFHEHGSVTYSRAGQRLHLANGAWLDGTPAPTLTAALGASGDFSFDLVIQPGDLTQEGPARILSLGVTQRAVNLMLGQSGSRLEMRVRTTATNPDGTRPHLVSADGVLDGRAQHVAFVRRGRVHLLYVDGRVCCQDEIDGQLNWDADYPLCIGNDHRGGFPWSGSCERVVLVGRAWSDDEIAARHRTWSAEAGAAPAR